MSISKKNSLSPYLWYKNALQKHHQYHVTCPVLGERLQQQPSWRLAPAPWVKLTSAVTNLHFAGQKSRQQALQGSEQMLKTLIKREVWGWSTSTHLWKHFIHAGSKPPNLIENLSIGSDFCYWCTWQVSQQSDHVLLAPRSSTWQGEMQSVTLLCAVEYQLMQEAKKLYPSVGAVRCSS